jgi:integrase
MVNENLITRQVEDYIAFKRSLGYIFRVPAGVLRRFASFTRTAGFNGSLTSEIAIQWASLNSDSSRLYTARRLEIIRAFARYISAFDSNAQIPPTGIFGRSYIRSSPYIYSDEEIALLIAEAGKLRSPDGVRAYTVAAAIGLLRSTGLRVAELTLLRIRDVCLADGYLFIGKTKFKKGRAVPLHPTATEELAKYRDFIREKLGKRDETDFFFVGSYGRRFNTWAFEYAFKHIRLVLTADSVRNRKRKVRLYDIRHTFACKTIKRWYESGIDVNQKLFLLSTYMGHAMPEHTYWYLSATPELLAVSCSRYEAAFGAGCLPETEPLARTGGKEALQ